MPAAPAIALVVSAIAGVASAGISASQAKKADKRAKEGLKIQEQAQAREQALANQQLNQDNQEVYKDPSAQVDAQTGGVGNILASLQKQQDKKKTLLGGG